jgi:hypothetical protein
VKAWAAMFVLGAVGITLLDQLHVRAGTTSYTDPTLAGQPWWVVPQFGLATVLGVLAARPFLSREGGSGRQLGWRVVLFAGAYATTALLFRYSLPLLALLVLVWAAWVVVAGEPARTIVYCLLFAMVGSAYEIALVAADLFAYGRPEVLGIQWWLPGLYLQAGLLGMAIARAVAEPEAVR